MISCQKLALGTFLGCCLLGVAAGCATTKRDPFARADISSPDFFPILPWDPYHGWGQPRVEKRNLGFEGIADCGFNLAGFVLPQDLAACRKLGLGAILLTTDPAFTNVQYIYDWKKLSDAEIDRRVKTAVEAGGKDPAIAGYFINDEPGVPDFPALAKAVAAVKKYAPGKLAYINLFPNYATLGAPDTSQLGAPSYGEYLERFVAEVQPQLLSYDNYMVQYSMDLQDRASAANYYNNLLQVRSVALEHRLPYLNIVASCQLQPGKAIPSPDNLLFQAYTTLAAGYRGVTWYTYFGDFYPYAPLAKSGGKTPTWAALQAVNRQVAALAPVLSHLASTGVYFSAPAPAENLPRLPGQLVKSVTCANPVMVGEFKHENGERYAMIVNLSLEHSAAFTLETQSPGRPISLISATDGSVSSFDAKAGYWLTAGQGVLLDLGK
jgi:hypothetical protein